MWPITANGSALLPVEGCVVVARATCLDAPPWALDFGEKQVDFEVDPEVYREVDREFILSLS